MTNRSATADLYENNIGYCLINYSIRGEEEGERKIETILQSNF